jgi:hypothetical protein
LREDDFFVFVVAHVRVDHLEREPVFASAAVQQKDNYTERERPYNRKIVTQRERGRTTER